MAFLLSGLSEPQPEFKDVINTTVSSEIVLRMSCWRLELTEHLPASSSAGRVQNDLTNIFTDKSDGTIGEREL